MLTTVVMYVVALAAYAVDLGFGRRRAAAAAEEAEAKAEAKAKVPAGAGARADTAESAAGTSGETAGEDEDGRTRIDWVRLAVLMTALGWAAHRSEEHTSELQSRENLVCRLLLEKKKRI